MAESEEELKSLMMKVKEERVKAGLKLNIQKTKIVTSSPIAMKRREVKSKVEKERYKHLNAEFQRIARRDKKAFHSDQCKE